MSCEICKDTGLVDVLDIWSIQREHIAHGAVSIDTAAALPKLKQAVRCPCCHGSDACEEDMQRVAKENGGSPWDEKTFKNRN